MISKLYKYYSFNLLRNKKLIKYCKFFLILLNIKKKKNLEIEN